MAEAPCRGARACGFGCWTLAGCRGAAVGLEVLPGRGFELDSACNKAFISASSPNSSAIMNRRKDTRVELLGVIRTIRDRMAVYSPPRPTWVFLPLILLARKKKVAPARKEPPPLNSNGLPIFWGHHGAPKESRTNERWGSSSPAQENSFRSITPHFSYDRQPSRIFFAVLRD